MNYSVQFHKIKSFHDLIHSAKNAHQIYIYYMYFIPTTIVYRKMIFKTNSKFIVRQNFFIFSHYFNK